MSFNVRSSTNLPLRDALNTTFTSSTSLCKVQPSLVEIVSGCMSWHVEQLWPCRGTQLPDINIAIRHSIRIISLVVRRSSSLAHAAAKPCAKCSPRRDFKRKFNFNTRLSRDELSEMKDLKCHVNRASVPAAGVNTLVLRSAARKHWLMATCQNFQLYRPSKEARSGFDELDALVQQPFVIARPRERWPKCLLPRFVYAYRRLA